MGISMNAIKLYDTTLRDGTQAEDFNLSLEDKIRTSKKLDELGIHYIEGGWPGSNPKDVAYFKEIRNYELKHSKVASFGSTHNPRSSAEKDRNLGALLKAKTEVITIFGKSWTVHVRDAPVVTRDGDPVGLFLPGGDLCVLGGARGEDESGD